MTLPVAVHVTAGVSPEGVDRLAHDIRAIGLDPALHAVPTRRSASDLIWVVLLALPVKPFLEHLAQKFADDAYSRLKALVGKALQYQREPSESRRVLILEDNTKHFQVELESDLPIVAYQQLFEMDLLSMRGRLHYDRNSRQWRTELDE